MLLVLYAVLHSDRISDIFYLCILIGQLALAFIYDRLAFDDLYIVIQIIKLVSQRYIDLSLAVVFNIFNISIRHACMREQICRSSHIETDISAEMIDAAVLWPVFEILQTVIRYGPVRPPIAVSSFFTVNIISRSSKHSRSRSIVIKISSCKAAHIIINIIYRVKGNRLTVSDRIGAERAVY